MADLTRIFGPGGVPFTVATPYAAKFQALLNDPEWGDYAFDAGQSGGYNPRNIAGTRTPSQHASGRAIDINWTRNARGTKGDINPDLARRIASRHGFEWGGDWKNPDPMHFQVAGAALTNQSLTGYAGLGGPKDTPSLSRTLTQGSDAMPYDASGRWVPEDAIAQQYRYADALQRQPEARSWAGVLANGLGGLGSGLIRSDAQGALYNNQGMMSKALRGVADVPPEEAPRAMLQSGVPALEMTGAKAALDDPNKEYRVRAAQAEQQGMQKGTPEWKAFVLTGALPSSNANKVDTPDERAAAAQQYGMDPNSDAYRQYVLTGRMPREDQQMLTATDKKAILEADEMVLSTQGAITSLNRAKELSKKAYDGATANERAWVASQFGAEGANATRELNQTVTEGALQQLKAIFGGMPTEGERKVLLEVQGSAELPQAVRERIYDRAIGLANNRLKFNQQRAAELRGGTFYKPEGGAGAPQDVADAMLSPAPSGVGGAPIRARNKDTGEVIEWNGSEWVKVAQ